MTRRRPNLESLCELLKKLPDSYVDLVAAYAVDQAKRLCQDIDQRVAHFNKILDGDKEPECKHSFDSGVPFVGIVTCTKCGLTKDLRDQNATKD